MAHKRDNRWFFLPIAGWVQQYQPEWLGFDAVAGVTLAAYAVPVSLAYAGSATVAEHGLPPVHWLEPHHPVKGWVAASLYSIKLGSLDRPGYDDFSWLERYAPVALVGRSIRLYYIP